MLDFAQNVDLSMAEKNVFGLLTFLLRDSSLWDNTIFVFSTGHYIEKEPPLLWDNLAAYQ